MERLEIGGFLWMVKGTGVVVVLRICRIVGWDGKLRGDVVCLFVCLFVRLLIPP